MNMPHILLLGAGFSRNWGGWLADEAFEYLLGHPRIDDGLRQLLWRYKGQGGFEAALDELQTETARRTERDKALLTSMMGGVVSNTPMLDHHQRLEKAILQMFADMDKGFGEIDDFNFGVTSHESITGLLTRFDAIFTLNQDLLLERHYLVDTMSKLLHPKEWQIPGMEPIAEPSGTPINEVKTWRPMADPSKFSVEKDVQPYFKLHGSSNWIDSSSGRQMLVIGGNKPATIKRREILKWNHEQFQKNVAKPDTRLMVIGYSFGDEHINVAIRDGAEKGTLKLFIIDPYGVDVLKKNRLAPPGYMFEKLQPHLIGASRRTLREIFGRDPVEHGKVMRFFS
jgi:hypothetical protein